VACAASAARHRFGSGLFQGTSALQPCIVTSAVTRVIVRFGSVDDQSNRMRLLVRRQPTQVGVARQ
jgi:hypothetical protein